VGVHGAVKGGGVSRFPEKQHPIGNAEAVGEEGKVGAERTLAQKDEAKAAIQRRRRPKKRFVPLHGVETGAKTHGKAIPDPPFSPQGIPRRRGDGGGRQRLVFQKQKLSFGNARLSHTVEDLGRGCHGEIGDGAVEPRTGGEGKVAVLGGHQRHSARYAPRQAHSRPSVGVEHMKAQAAQKRREGEGIFAKAGGQRKDGRPRKDGGAASLGDQKKEGKPLPVHAEQQCLRGAKGARGVFVPQGVGNADHGVLLFLDFAFSMPATGVWHPWKKKPQTPKTAKKEKAASRWA
jgi:hypothetical protein